MMNVFSRKQGRCRQLAIFYMPYPDFQRSVEVLDYRRLNVMMISCFNLLSFYSKAHTSLAIPRYHGIGMWAWFGYEKALLKLAETCEKEWLKRGYKTKFRSQWYHNSRWSSQPDVPDWLSDSEFCESQQAYLVKKNPELYRPLFPDVDPNLPLKWVTGPKAQLRFKLLDAIHRDNAERVCELVAQDSWRDIFSAAIHNSKLKTVHRLLKMDYKSHNVTDAAILDSVVYAAHKRDDIELLKTIIDFTQIDVSQIYTYRCRSNVEHDSIISSFMGALRHKKTNLVKFYMSLPWNWKEYKLASHFLNAMVRSNSLELLRTKLLDYKSQEENNNAGFKSMIIELARTAISKQRIQCLKLIHQLFPQYLKDETGLFLRTTLQSHSLTCFYYITKHFEVKDMQASDFKLIGLSHTKNDVIKITQAAMRYSSCWMDLSTYYLKKYLECLSDPRLIAKVRSTLVAKELEGINER